MVLFFFSWGGRGELQKGFLCPPVSQVMVFDVDAPIPAYKLAMRVRFFSIMRIPFLIRERLETDNWLLFFFLIGVRPETTNPHRLINSSG